MESFGRSRTLGMLVNCSHCRTPLQIPPEATTSISCILCNQVTIIIDPSKPPPYANYNYNLPPAPAPMSFFNSTPSFVYRPPPYNQMPPPLPPPLDPCGLYPPQPTAPYGHMPPAPAPPSYDHTPPGTTPPSYDQMPPWSTPPSYNQMPPASPSYFPMPAARTARKRALICGISYKGTKFELNGCINDAKCMKYLLINKFQFPESSIRMLTDEEETDPINVPTKKNLISAMRWLVEDCQPGDSLVFHYSGHGSQQRDNDGDELDGFDETICPLDFEDRGVIVDDKINNVIVKPLPPGVKLHAIIDACHSGTVLDLPFLCRMDRTGKYVWEDHRPRTGAWKGTSGGEVYSFSGCDDDQTSADTAALSKVTSTGAMTYSFIQAIERGKATTYGELLSEMRSAIRSAGQPKHGVEVITTIISILLEGRPEEGLKQEPQLTCNEQFDVYGKPFSI